MTARHNMPAPHREIDLVMRGYAYVARTGLFRVAERDGRIAAIACAIMRGPHWFLSGFWADPTMRLQGIGGPLLRALRDEGRAAGARVFYVWASIDAAAIAAYMKLGMLPGTQLFAFAGTPATLPAVPALATVDLRPELVGELDRDLVGVRRDDDHRYWLERADARGRAVLDGKDVVGYYHVHDGTIGPIGWTRGEVGEAVLATALIDAARTTHDVQLTVPGMNHIALRLALSSGLRLIRQSHLLWTEPVGHMERYVPSGPLLF